jgi:hypothetical protein
LTNHSNYGNYFSKKLFRNPRGLIRAAYPVLGMGKLTLSAVLVVKVERNPILQIQVPLFQFVWEITSRKTTGKNRRLRAF